MVCKSTPARGMGKLRATRKIKPVSYSSVDSLGQELRRVEQINHSGGTVPSAVKILKKGKTIRALSRKMKIQ